MKGSPELPPKLYHYTSQKGLLGIIQNRELWMSNIRYLNDSSEFSYTLELVKKELDIQIKSLKTNELRGLFTEYTKSEIKNNILSLIKDVLNGYQDDNDINIYIFSLSKLKDDLNQWRGYCPDEGRFCIEFDSNKLDSIITNKGQQPGIIKCIYKKSEIKELLESLFDDLWKQESSIEPIEYGNKGVKYPFGKFILNVLRISPRIKHESFSKELEYRINYISNVDEEKHYREGKSMITPYIKFSPTDGNSLLPITKVVVGPTPHPELSKSSVELLLKSNGYDIPVECSKIPYRSW